MNTSNPIARSYLSMMQIVFFTVVLMYYGKALFIPLSFSLLVALILYPFCHWLEKHKWPRSLSIAVALTLVFILFTGIAWLMLWQLNYLLHDLPVLVQKTQGTLQQLQQWVNEKVGVVDLETGWLEQMVLNTGGNAGTLVRTVVKSMGGLLFSLFLIPVFTALFLYHREQFVRFLKSTMPLKYHERLITVLHEASFAYNKYIIGLIKVYIVVGILNSIGLLMLGVPHAILFGMLTAFMTMIPYVGIIISSLLPITVAWITTDSLVYPLAVVAVFSFVQYLENSVIFPKIVGQQLNVSTWAILVALLAGGIIWGVSGMVIFMPFVAILKIISGHIEEWEPLHILLSRAEKIKTPVKKDP